MPDSRPVKFRPTAITAALAVIGAAVLFGSTGTAQELGPESATPLGVGTIRIAIGAVALWCAARRRPRWSTVRLHAHLVAIGAIGVAAYQPGFFTGTERLGVALGTVVALGSGPIFVGLIEWLAGNPPGSRWTVATTLALGGGAMLVFAGDSGSSFSVIGLAGALAAGLGYALYAVATKRLIIAGIDSTEASAWQFSLGATALLPLLVTQPLDWLGSASGVVMALHLGVLCTGLAYVLYGWGLRLLDTSTATTLTLAEPVTAGVLAVVVLDERLLWFGWCGAVLVVTGLLVVGSARRHLAPTDATRR